MDYEIIELEEKILVGVSARTKNSDENMTSVIGELWQNFFGKGIFHQIKNKVNDKTIGLYSDYETDENSEYSVTVCCEVSNPENDNLAVKKIPAGKYAKFIVKGHMQKAVSDFWQKLWGMSIDRKFDFDFEEYQSGGDMENAEIHIYISLK